jgi:hypothetical protein
MKTLIVSLAELTLVLVLIGRCHAEPGEIAPTQPPVADVIGEGGWNTAGKVAKPTQRWHVDALKLTNGLLWGRLTVSNSPVLSEGNLQGQIAGSKVAGNVMDDDGNTLATFDGTVSPTGMEGTYRDRTGEVGNWSWDGPLPE